MNNDPNVTESTTRRGYMHWFISGAISVALVYYLMRQIELRDLLDTLRNVHLPSLVLFVAVSLAGLGARVTRYWLLLEVRPSWRDLAVVTLVRNCLVDLLPARLGSLSFVYLATTRLNVPVQDSLATFFLALVFDMVAIAPLLMLAILVVGGAVSTGGTALVVLAGALLIVSLVAVALMAPVLDFGATIMDRCGAGNRLGRVELWTRLSRLATDTAAQVRQVRQRGVLLPVLLVSLLVRIFKFGAYYVLLQAVLIPHGMVWGTLNVFEVFLGIAGAELSATLPIHGIAGLGTYEAAWALGFTQLGFTAELAILSGFATHLISQVYDYGLGLAALLWIMRPGFRQSDD